MTTASPSRPSGYITRPDYRIDILRGPNRMAAIAGGRIIAASDRALIVDEQDHALVVYFPREDVDVAALLPLATPTTHCPYKGDAHYYTLSAAPAKPIAWSYAAPYAEVAAIAGYIAFYQDKIELRLGSQGD